MRLLQSILLSSFCTVIAYATTLSQTIALSEKNPSIQAAAKEAKVYEQLSEVAKSAQYPSLDLSYGATYLYEDPVMYLQGSFPGFPPSTPPVQMQAKNLYVGTLKLTYPLFSGFAISASIDKANLRKYRALLAVQDAKRNLYMHVVQAYAAALALKHLIDSQEEAYQATQQSYKKAKAFFDLGMISQAELYRIDASKNAIMAELIQMKNSYDIALSQLSLMTQQKITDVEPLPKYQSFSLDSLTQKALEHRPDIKALQTMLKEQESQIKLAKSSYYPTVGVFVQASHRGDTPELNGDGYTNKDRSAAGFMINYNLFSGFKTQNQVEAAQEGKLSIEFTLQAYSDKVKTEIRDNYLSYQSLLSSQAAAQAQVKAQHSYLDLVQQQFENQVADADTLSRAISSLALAKATLIAIDAKLYASYAKALLQVDSETFLNTLNTKKD